MTGLLNRGIKAADKIVIGLGELESQDKPRGQDIAKLALAFDWAYDAMTAEQRKYVVDKLSKLTGIDETAKKIKDGLKIKGETFHREEWAFHSYICWPEIALAYHNPNAELVYKARWNYDWYWAMRPGCTPTRLTGHLLKDIITARTEENGL
jgi:hypothetical protein